MGNCASEPKTKGDDAAAVPVPEPRKEESVQAKDVNSVQLQEESKDEQNNDGGHNKQPSLGALLKEVYSNNSFNFLNLIVGQLGWISYIVIWNMDAEMHACIRRIYHHFI